jgi:hypothetical protein
MCIFGDVRLDVVEAFGGGDGGSSFLGFLTGFLGLATA